MNDIINLAIVLGCLALPFVAMPLLWRRMKRIRNETYQQQKQDRRAQPWEDSLGADGKLGTSIYRWQNVAWDDSLLPDSGGSRCVNRDFSDYRII